MNNLPTFDQPLVDRNTTSKVWYFFFKSLYTGASPGPEGPVTLTGSPFTYSATQRGFLIVQGGTVSLVQFSRGSTNYTTGQTQGCFPVSAGDRLIINYSVAPTVTFVPQ